MDIYRLRGCLDPRCCCVDFAEELSVAFINFSVVTRAAVAETRVWGTTSLVRTVRSNQMPVLILADG
jgi:hypothetical protein